MPDVAVLDLGRAESEGKASMGLPVCHKALTVLDLGCGESEGKASMGLPVCHQALTVLDLGRGESEGKTSMGLPPRSGEDSVLRPGERAPGLHRVIKEI